MVKTSNGRKIMNIIPISTMFGWKPLRWSDLSFWKYLQRRKRIRVVVVVVVVVVIVVVVVVVVMVVVFVVVAV